MSRLTRARAVLGGVPRVVRTVRHLTPRQVVWRAWTAGRFGLYARVPGLAALGLGRAARAAPAGVARLTAWVERKYLALLSPRQRELAVDAAKGRFTFLGRTLEPAGPTVDWQAEGMSRLWRYHLHYGDYVAGLALGARHGHEPAWAARAGELMDDWIAANPPGSRPGWEPYPLSLRVVNWALALVALGEAVAPDARAERRLGSLADQGRFLARHPEHHLGGNHLVKNAKALFVLGVLLEGRDAAAWRRRGSTLLRAALRRQVLTDGGHVERSPLYHAQVLDDVLDCLAIATAPGADAVVDGATVGEWRKTAERMTTWLGTMLHPDGGLPLFNDCVVAGEPAPQAILAHAEAVLGPGAGVLPGPAVALEPSGYYVLESGRGRAVVDCGPIGPDELPAHAHADTLSFELAWAGERVIVDSGTAEYAADALRRYVRSTAAHNTVVVDGEEQSEMWASFRVGRRARPLGACVAWRDGVVLFTGAHDGYRRLGVVHHRHLVGIGDVWVVADELIGRGRHRFESLVHLHPAFRVERDGEAWRVIGATLQLRLTPLGRVAAELGGGWYCPDWGQAWPTPVVRLSGEAVPPVTFGYVVAPADREVAMALELDAGGVTLSGTVDGSALRVRSERCTSSS